MKSGTKVFDHLHNSVVKSHTITEVEIKRLKGGWKETGKVHEIFSKRLMLMAANGVCVREAVRTNRKKKVKRDLKYWKKLWEMYEISPLQDALKQHFEERTK